MPLPKVLPEVESKQRAAQDSAARVQSGHATKNTRTVANRYVSENKLGSGAFGTAYLTTDLKCNNEKKVLKVISVTDLKPDETVDAVREARLLAKLDHPHIVRFHDSFMDGDTFCIVTEFCEKGYHTEPVELEGFVSQHNKLLLSVQATPYQGGDLDAKISQWRERGGKFEETLILDWFIQLTTAVSYIHERRVLHRDLKSRNIFLRNNLIKLGDFGISRILMGTFDLATTFTGTPYYMSPEVLKHDGYNSKSDVWSLGCVLYELCTLHHAFQGQNLMAVMYKIVEGKQPRLPDHFSPELCTLFSRMLDKNPSLRPSAVQILQEPFIQDRLLNLHGKLSRNSSKNVLEEADAIARALSPVKKKTLVQDERLLTPKQRAERRKKLRADMEAEKIKEAVARNYSEGRKRFNEHKKKQMRVIPPWVEEHPDVFSDPNFSITNPSTPSPPPPLPPYHHDNRSELSVITDNSMAMSISNDPQQGRHIAWELQDHHHLHPNNKDNKGDSGEEGDHSNSDDEADGPEAMITSQPPFSPDRVSEKVATVPPPLPPPLLLPKRLDLPQEEEDYIPDDPVLAETHYSQFNDFESDENNDSGQEENSDDDDDDDGDDDEDEMEDLLVCIEDALELSKKPDKPQEVAHDEISPFTPLARERRIALLKKQCIEIYGEAVFGQVYQYLRTARYSAEAVEEKAIMGGLRQIVPNVRDCFLVDQLVFLEKQAEAVSLMHKPLYSQT